MMMTKKSPPPDDEFIKPLMDLALSEAKLAIEDGDVPVGAVVARRDSGLVIAHTHNQKERDNDPTAHAEILALRQAESVLRSWRLSECLLVVTLEPCTMCAGACTAARIGQVIYGATDPKAGALGSLYHFGSDPRLNHEYSVTGGVQAQAGGELLTDFFSDKRSQA